MPLLTGQGVTVGRAAVTLVSGRCLSLRQSQGTAVPTSEGRRAKAVSCSVTSATTSQPITRWDVGMANPRSYSRCPKDAPITPAQIDAVSSSRQPLQGPASSPSGPD